MLRSREKSSSKLAHHDSAVDTIDTIDAGAGGDEREYEHDNERRQDNRKIATGNKRGSICTLPLFMLALWGALLVLATVTSFFRRPSLVDPSSSSSTVGAQTNRLQEDEEQRGRRNLLEVDSSDGTTFNGFPVTYRPGSSQNPDSSVHCVGENYGVDAWMYRSCQFRHLCFDLDSQELVLFPSAEEKRLLDLLSQRDSTKRHEVTIQSIVAPDTKIALGPMDIQNLSSGGQSNMNDQRRHLEWFPTAVTDSDDPLTMTNGYYELPENVVLVPFSGTSTNTNTQQHWLWQNFLSIFTLLSIFDLQHQQLALIDYNDHPECPPSSSSDSSSSACHSQSRSQMLAAMGVKPEQYRSRQGSTLQLNPQQATAEKRQSNFVCARTGAAGLGMIANLAPKPAQVAEEWLWTHTTGRGATLREFRDYMARHLGVSIPSAVGDSKISGSSDGTAPLTVTFFEQGPKEGVSDGTKPSRELESANFEESYRQVRSVLSEQQASVEWFHTSTLDFALQASKAAESAIFITLCGEQTVAATFLPQGASLIVLCDDGGAGSEKDRKPRWSNRLDWRVLNNAAYFRTHWLPLQSIRTKEGVATLARLVQSELDLVREEV